MSVRLIERKGGFWVDIRVRLTDRTKYRERVKTPARTRSAAMRWGLAREGEIIRNGRPEETKEEVASEERQRVTFDEFAAQYLADKEADGDEVKPSYLQFMRYTINGHLKRHLGALALEEITQAKIEDFRRALKVPRKSGRVCGDTGVNKVLALLGTVLRAAFEKKLIKECPKITMLKREQRAKRGKARIKADGVNCYTDAQFGTLLEAAQGVSRDAHIVALLGGDHGLRRGEIMSLKWSDIDAEAATLTVNTSVWLHRGKPHEGPPKGGSSRELPITPALSAALGAGRRYGVYVLPRFSYAEMTELVCEVQRAAGFVVTGKAHVLRHTFCSRLAMKGVPLKVIQTLAGHADIQTTERYLHSDREQERAAMAMLAETSGARLGHELFPREQYRCGSSKARIASSNGRSYEQCCYRIRGHNN